MKQFFTLILLVLLSHTCIRAQDANPQRGGRIEALKIGYLTKKLSLTPEEAQKFWPIYNNYAAELKDVRVDLRQGKQSELDSEEKALQIRKRYSNEFAKAISPDKVNTFFRSEKEFSGYVQKELQERKQERQSLR